MAIVALEGMRFFAHHGVFAEEKTNGNTFEVDVWVDTGELPLPESDDLEDALDYGKIYAVAAEVMAKPVDLLETLVLAIGKGCMAESPAIASVRVRVSKFAPPVPGTVARSFVEETFRR
ncbi:MAG: dihydroneopterin aldolase [Bacteroidota bacterium]